jgi:predicted homoserine dehydrogenase-like protein
MNSEFHVTTGSYFMDQGLLTEAAGDQPGTLAALKEDVVQMGFKPLVYGNIKRFLNRNPEREEMKFWAKKQGISLPQVTAFTDGTKVQIEQALVANGLDGTIAVNGLIGIESQDVHAGARTLADGARRLGQPFSDYVLSTNAPAGVFIAAEHSENQREYLQYLKMGDGPYYILQRNYHLCHLEIAKTIRRVFRGEGALLTNSRHPKISVCAIAKTACKPGEEIERGIGSFKVRGETIRIVDAPEHVPIGLMDGAVVCRDVQEGEMLTFDDVELPNTQALQIWRKILSRVMDPDSQECVDGQGLSTS